MNSRRSNLFPIYKLSLPVYIRATAQESSRETKDLSCATQLRTIGGLAASRIAKDEPDSKVEYVYPLSLSLFLYLHVRRAPCNKRGDGELREGERERTGGKSCVVMEVYTRAP